MPLRLLTRSPFLPLLLLLASLSLLLSCQRAAENVPRLYIVSPHGSDIKQEFETAFSRWHTQKYGSPVKIEWGELGGTGTIMRYLAAQYATRKTCGYDLIWGGGSGTFDDLVSRGFLTAANPPIPPDVLNAIPPNIHGVTLRGPDNLWIGATLSNFGIVVNKPRLAELHLPTPTTWESLTGPEWIGNLSLADPSKSFSVRTCYDMILQQYGWEKGWPLLVKLFANAESIKEGGSNPSEETGLGNVAAGVVIDFFGRVAIVKQGAAICAFIVPTGGSALDPDPIAMLKGAPNPALASHMIEFVLTPEGQKLWAFKPGTPGGPIHKALGRMALIPSLYETQAAYMTDPTNPFQAAAPLKVDRALQKERGVFAGDLIKAALIDNRDALVAARKAVAAAGDPPELMEMFNLLPFPGDQTTAIKDLFEPKDKAATERNQDELRQKWRGMFAQQFNDIRVAATRK